MYKFACAHTIDSDTRRDAVAAVAGRGAVSAVERADGVHTARERIARTKAEVRGTF